jgi:hypothetical protein
MKKLLLLTFVFTLFACSSGDDDNTNSEFEGQWSGVFFGDDNGRWTAYIGSNGAVSGSAYSVTFSENYSLIGSVSSSGEFQATLGASSNGSVFNGQLDGPIANGEWENSDAMMSGNWSGSKDNSSPSPINEDLEGVWSTTITDSDSSSNNTANQTLTLLSSGICAVINIWDHSGETYSATGTWSSTESTVTINWDNGETDTADYELSNNNNTCAITRSDGVVIVYTRV